MSDASSLRIEPVGGPLDATVVVPGSKSLTNRALVAAALAPGRSVLHGALRADDTEAMVACLRQLGITVDAADAATTVAVVGCGGAIPVAAATLDARQSGTTARFVAPLVALGTGRYVLDGSARLRERPMADLADALRRLGVDVDGDHLPLTIQSAGVVGGTVAVAADASSQFASGLLLAGPAMRDGLRVELTTAAVSRPYLDMTVAVMRAFGATVDDQSPSTFVVAPGGYRPTTYAVEPDASAASYFFAAAAICGGRVTIEGLGSESLQGDLGFVALLRQMGAVVEQTATSTTVVGAGPLHGIEADLSDLSDMTPTLAVTAAFASSPTRITGVGFIRHKESDRIDATVTELRRMGIDAEAEPDGLVIRPGPFRPGRVETYDDHRMAMAFSLVGLRIPGVEISDPGCVAKTFPGFFTALASLRGTVSLP